MRALVILAAVVVALSAQPVRAQTCPEDVGAALAEACPCDADGQGRAWKNHGQYASCVAHATNTLVALSLITGEQKGVIQSTAAKSGCGMKK